jgi:hypothetical protein
VIAVELRYKNVNLASDEGARSADPFVSGKTDEIIRSSRSLVSRCSGLVVLPNGSFRGAISIY